MFVSLNCTLESLIPDQGSFASPGTMIEGTKERLNKPSQLSTSSNPNHPKQKVRAVVFYHEDPKDPCSPSSTMIALAVCPGRLNSANLDLELDD